MKILDNVTLVCVDCYKYGEAIVAIKKTLQQITPGRAVFFTDIDIKIDNVETILIPSIKSKREYSVFCIKELYKYVKTKFVLIIQNDGYVINGDSWLDEFENYDFIGAPWLYNDGRNVGNGGVSLRSYKLQLALGTDDFIKVCDPEDEVIGRLYRGYLEERYNIFFPDEDLADKFSFELRTPIYKTFAFHGNFHKPYQETVVIKRTGAMGDVIQVEPVLEYFHVKGYRVVLDTLPQFKMLFINHYFKVHFSEELDQRLLDQCKTYNLDMSYESKPNQLHLKTYFEYCGITDYTLRNPKLSVGFDAKDKRYKIFPKYCILHIDRRPQASRNIEGVDWYKVVQYLLSKGYVVLNLGKGEHIEISGAIEMNIVNESLLSYVCAGADLFIGIDSGISNICSAFNIPSIICFGSVNPRFIHANGDNKIYLVNIVCDKPFCWHTEITTVGVPCYLDDNNPPCNKFTSERIINSIKQLTNE